MFKELEVVFKDPNQPTEKWDDCDYYVQDGILTITKETIRCKLEEHILMSEVLSIFTKIERY